MSNRIIKKIFSISHQLPIILQRHITLKTPQNYHVQHSSHIKFRISSHVRKFDLCPENSIQVSIGIIEDKMVKMVVMALGSGLSTRLPATHESSISSNKLCNITIPPKLDPTLRLPAQSSTKFKRYPKPPPCLTTTQHGQIHIQAGNK